MGLGKTQRPNLKSFSLKIKTKDLAAPVFIVSSKNELGEWVENKETQTAVSGNLISVKPTETKWQNKIIRSVNVTLQDKDEVFFVTVPWTNLGRGLMNRLLGLKTFSDVEISLYQTKPKEQGGKTYPQASVRQNGELVKWKFENSELPAPKEVLFKGEKMRDFTEMEAFLSKQLVELNDAIRKNSPVVANPEAVPASTETESSEPKTEDVPF